MKLTCPSCSFCAEIDALRIPADGTRVTCPKCMAAFSFARPFACPKCGHEQETAESCSRCGVIFEKYRVAEERRCPVEVTGTMDPAPSSCSMPADNPTTFRFGHGRGEILSWSREGYLSPENLPQALHLAGTLPGPAQWRRFLDGLALWLGAIFLAAAVIFFFAYNWQALGHYARFGIAELLLAAAVIAAWRIGLERLSGKAALLTATLLVGALLALVGQTYQTGADTWELFATWALFALPWVAISRFAPLWLVWLVLVNLSACLYFKTFGGFFGFIITTEGLFWTLTALNSAALAVWELAAGAGIDWLDERWPPRVVATTAVGSVTLLACWGIVEHDTSGIAELVGYVAFVAGGYITYRWKLPDLYMLATGVLSLIIVFTTLLGHNLARHGDAGAFLFVGLVVLGMSALGGWWLRAVGREVEQ